MPIEKTELIWMDGELVPWDEAKVHVLVHGLHYGSGVFEGIRAYETPKGPAVFRLADHMRRLHTSAKLLYMELPYSVEELRTATHELVRANGLPAAYIRPIAFYGSEAMGISAKSITVHVAIAAWSWGAYLGADVFRRAVPVTEIEIRRDRDEAMVRELAGALAVPLVPSRRVVDDHHARERTGAEGPGNVRIDGVAVVHLHRHGFGDHAFVLIGLVRVSH